TGPTPSTLDPKRWGRGPGAPRRVTGSAWPRGAGGPRGGGAGMEDSAPVPPRPENRSHLAASHAPVAALLTALMLCGCAGEPAFDVVIRGGTLVDGGGGEPYTGDLAIRGDSIAAVGQVRGREIGRAHV